MRQHGSKYFAHRHTLDPWGGVKRSNHWGGGGYKIQGICLVNILIASYAAFESYLVGGFLGMWQQTIKEWSLSQHTKGAASMLKGIKALPKCIWMMIEFYTWQFRNLYPFNSHIQAIILIRFSQNFNSFHKLLAKLVVWQKCFNIKVKITSNADLNFCPDLFFFNSTCSSDTLSQTAYFSSIFHQVWYNKN